MSHNLRRLVDGLLTQCTSWSYATAQPYQQRRMERYVRRRFDVCGHAVLIYQMGKVGSTTIYETLRETVEAPVFHIHTLIPDRLDRLGAIQREAYPRTRSVQGHYLESRALLPYVTGARPAPHWTVITLVRDPIARNLSAFFQTLETDAPHLDLATMAQSMPEDAVVARLIEAFVDDFKDHDRPLDWFDDELKQVFGHDIYAHEFDTAMGYQIDHGDGFDLLTIRLDDLDRVGAEACRSFLGRDDIELVRGNDGSRKSYADFYRRVREEIVLPSAYLDRMYDARYTRHFYTPDERAAFRARWEREETLVRQAG